MNNEFEEQTVLRALEGDAEAGAEALRLCISGLDGGRLSDGLAVYLADRLRDVLAGIPPKKALCIARDGGRPREPFPRWKTQIAAIDALLALDGVRPEARIEAMREARRQLHPQLLGELDRNDAIAIRRAYAPMRKNCDRAALEWLAGAMGENLRRFVPKPRRR